MSDNKISSVEFGIPGMTRASAKDFEDYSVKYLKCDLDDPGDVAMLSNLETRALREDGIVMLTKDKMGFMTQYFLIVSYLEKNNA